MSCGCGGLVGANGAPLDQVRAAGVSLWSAPQVITVGDEPLIVDLLPPSTLVNGHWILEHCSFRALLTLRAPTNGTPINGLFLCPAGAGTAAAETLALGQGQPGFVMNARRLVLPISERACPSESLPNGSFAINYTLQPGFKATVPAGWLVRAIVNCGPNTPTPGPGANSVGILEATAYAERNPR